jgi:iron-sulfur cluster assembly protein
MLTLTQNAISLLNRIEHSPSAPEGTGLRIAADPNVGDMTFRLAGAPHEGDEVVARSGAVVYLDYEASIVLSDKTLDARETSDGRVQFTVTDEEMA